jgi:RimJ/RimL family protein N-acetyltransferase
LNSLISPVSSDINHHTMSTTTNILDPAFTLPTPRLTISHLDPSKPTHCTLMLDLMHGKKATQRLYFAASMVPDVATAKVLLAAGKQRMAETGYGRFIVSLKPTSTSPSSNVEAVELEPIGVVSLNLARHANTPSPTVPDLGFNFLDKHHGQGYAMEAASALMRFYREEKGCMAFAGLTDLRNVEARRLLGRLGFEDRGMRCVKGVIMGGEGMELSVWTVGVGGGEGALAEVGL